jgi:4-hydroxy-3-polyprenylbenzoate decarboxylase
MAMNLILAVTGATGAYAARLLLEKSPWPVTLVASDWGKEIYRRECGPFEELVAMAKEVCDNHDLAASPSSGSVPNAGLVILPCSCNALAKVAGGLGDTLISRAAHGQLKERRPLVLCVREAPWGLIDLENARRVAAAGAVVMPMSPPFYMFAKADPRTVTMHDLLAAYVDRVLAVLGRSAPQNWETAR